jgi:hypothetical protein
MWGIWQTILAYYMHLPGLETVQCIKALRVEEDRTPYLKNCGVHIAENPYMGGY